MRVLPEFNKLLKERLVPGLRSLGFSGRLPGFRRDENETIHCVWLQGASGNAGRYVNWGYHLSFVPLGYSDPIDTSKITQPECEITGRIQMEGDLRWPYGDTPTEMQECAERLSVYTIDEVQQKVDALANPEAVFCAITADDLLSDAPNVQRMHLTLGRGAQWLYHINMHYGHVDRALEIAQAAVENETAKTHPRWFLRKELEKHQIRIDK